MSSVGLSWICVVVLTSRHEKDGMQAVANFNKRELPVRYHQLDVTNPIADFKVKGFFNPRIRPL